MLWLLLIAICIIAWGITDIFYKKGSTPADTLSHLKYLVWNGIIAVTAAILLWYFSGCRRSLLEIITNDWTLTLVTFCYPLALLMSLIGMRYLAASVVSPLQNIDSAIAAVFLYLYFAVTGNTQVIEKVTPMDLTATICITVGVILLGVMEHRQAKASRSLAPGKGSRPLGGLALLFPLAYNLVDAVFAFQVGITVGGGGEGSLSDVECFILCAAGFTLVAAGAWLYMLIVKGYVYNPFRKQESIKCAAAVGDNIGMLTCMIATMINPILTTPIISAYCLVTILAARLFLKEKLTGRQYLCLGFLLIGIALLSVSEVLKNYGGS